MPDVYFVRPNNPNALVVIPPLNLGYLSAALGGHGKMIDAQSKAFWKFYAHTDRFFKTLARVKPSQIKGLIKRLFSYHIV